MTYLKYIGLSARSCAIFALVAAGAANAQQVGGGGGGTVSQGSPATSAPWLMAPWIGGAANSSTNGLYSNSLQGNAVLSVTNGLYSNILQGNAALSGTNGLYANLLQGNVALSAANPLPVSTSPNGVTSTAAATTVTAGGTFQSLFAASGTRKGCFIQNPTTATEVLYVFFGLNASALTTNSVSLSAGASVSCNVGPLVLQDNVSVTGPTTGHAFVAFSQ